MSSEHAIPRVGSKVQVYRGVARETAGGLVKKDILAIKQPNGTYRYVSKLKHRAGMKNPWIKAVAQARKKLGGVTDKYDILVKEGSRLHDLALEIYHGRK
jgi:hypothetical protein